ncbi:MAG: hypothetical protein ABH833_03950 [Parcubacteria group bacterium]
MKTNIIIVVAVIVIALIFVFMQKDDKLAGDDLTPTLNTEEPIETPVETVLVPAQTPPQATQIPTPTETVSSAPEPTPEATPIPTPTLTSEPTDEPTPTSESTPEPTITPTPEPTPQTIIVERTSYGFAPNTVTIEIGDSIEFKNNSFETIRPASNPHYTHDAYPGRYGCLMSTFDACTNMEPGQSWTFEFEFAGRWDYHDHLHPTNNGTIIVTDQNQNQSMLIPSTLFSSIYYLLLGSIFR